MTSQYNEKINKVKTALENVFEKKSNKVTSWSSTTTDVHYPSEKLVKDTLDNVASNIDAVDYYFDDTTEELVFEYGTVNGIPLIADNLTTNSSTQVLSAKQGKVLNDMIGDAIDFINQ